MDSQSFHQGNTLGAINTTLHQEHQKMCTRNSPCHQCILEPSHQPPLSTPWQSPHHAWHFKMQFKPIMCMNWNFSHTCTQIPWNPTWNTLKVATVQTFIKDSPSLLQPIILQTVLDDTYINDGGFRAKSIMELSETQQEIESILNKGGFQIKSWEHSGENGSSKYLGMTRDCPQNCYLLKFRLSLHKNLWNTCRGQPQFQISPRPFCTYHQEKCPQFYDPTSRSNQSCSSTDVLCTITI